MNNSLERSRLYDAAKCVATLLVVIAHSTRMYTPLGAIPVEGESAFLRLLTELIYTFHMPLFMMLSGCVYGYCIGADKYKNKRSFVALKARKLLIPYLVFGAVLVAPVMCALKITKRGYLGYVVRDILLSGDARHLWYLLSLFWIFIIYMLLRPLLQKGWVALNLCGGISISLFIVSLLAPTSLQMQSALSYQLYFFAGIVYERFESRIGAMLKGTLPTCLALSAFFAVRGVFEPSSAIKMLCSFAGIALIMTLCRAALRFIPRLFSSRVYLGLKKNSFGIYLFHPMIIYVMYHFLGKYGIEPVILSFLITVASIALSVAATALVRLLRLRILIGE